MEPPWFTCSQITPTTCTCGANTIQISPIQTGFQARILPFRVILLILFNRDIHIGKIPYIETALPWAVHYLGGGGWFLVCFLNKGGAALLSGLLLLLQKPPLQQEALPYNSYPSHSSHTSKPLCQVFYKSSGFCLSWQAFANTVTLCCLNRKQLKRTCQSLLWNSKQRKRRMGYCLMQGPYFLLPLMLLIRLFLGLSCRVLVPFQEGLPSAGFTRHIHRARFSSFMCISNMGLLTLAVLLLLFTPISTGIIPKPTVNSC